MVACCRWLPKQGVDKQYCNNPIFRLKCQLLVYVNHDQGDAYPIVRCVGTRVVRLSMCLL